jgi:hypothetical protein
VRHLSASFSQKGMRLRLAACCSPMTGGDDTDGWDIDTGEQPHIREMKRLHIATHCEKSPCRDDVAGGSRESDSLKQRMAESGLDPWQPIGGCCRSPFIGTGHER